MKTTHNNTKERVFNLFLDMNERQIIFQIRAAWHEKAGSDKRKLGFLERNVNSDLARAKSFPVPKRYRIVNLSTGHQFTGLAYENYWRMLLEGSENQLFEEIFQELESSSQPLVVITPVFDGQVRIDGTFSFNHAISSANENIIHRGSRHHDMQHMKKELMPRGLIASLLGNLLEMTMPAGIDLCSSSFECIPQGIAPKKAKGSWADLSWEAELYIMPEEIILTAKRLSDEEPTKMEVKSASKEIAKWAYDIVRASTC